MPSLSVVHAAPSERRKLAPALSSPPKQKRAIEETRREPFETHRYLAQLPSELLHHLIDHAATDHGLTDRRSHPPARTLRQQVSDGDRQILVRVHQPERRRDDSVAVRIRIVGERYLVLIFHPHNRAIA